MMPAGPNRCDNGVSTEAAAGGTWLRIRNRRASQPVAPAFTDSAETAKSTTPRPASSPAAQGFGTRAGRFGHHHDPPEIIGTKQPAHRPGGPGAACGCPADPRAYRGYQDHGHLRRERRCRRRANVMAGDGSGSRDRPRSWRDRRWSARAPPSGRQRPRKRGIPGTGMIPGAAKCRTRTCTTAKSAGHDGDACPAMAPHIPGVGGSSNPLARTKHPPLSHTC